MISPVIFLFLLLATFSTTWIVLFTFGPDIVCCRIDDEPFLRPDALPDPAKCFMGAILSSFVVTILVVIISSLPRFS